MATYSNPLVIGNTGVPPDTLHHNAVWPDGLCKDSSDFIYEVRGWDEPHYDINKRDPATGNTVSTTRQVLSGYLMQGVAVEPDGTFAYCTGFSGQGTPEQTRVAIWRFSLAVGLQPWERKTNFTSAGADLIVYDYGAIPTSDPDPQCLHSIAVSGSSLWVTDSFGNRLLKYDKVSGSLQGSITGLPDARGLTIAANGDIWVAHSVNKVNSYTSAGVAINTTTLSGVSQIVALSIAGSVMAVADRTTGIRTYPVSSGTLLTSMSSYGLPWQPGDGDPQKVREIYGLVQLSDGGLVFSDRIGFNGRIQRIGSWVQLGLEFTSGMTFAKENPSRWISSARNVYSVTGSSWTFVGNGMSEPFSSTSVVDGIAVTTGSTYFGNFASTHVGPPRLLKLGNNSFLYYPAGASVGVYRLIDNVGRAPTFRLCACLCGSGQPGPDGTTNSQPYLDEHRITWQWSDAAGDGVVHPEIISAQNPSTYLYINTASVDNDGTIWFRELDADCLSRIPLNGLNSAGNPVYRFQDKVVTFTRPEVQGLLGISTAVEFQLASRADGDVYCLIKCKDNPAIPTDGGQWMGGNAIVCFSPAGVAKWGKIMPWPLWVIGMAAIDHDGGFVCGSNNTIGPGTIYHFDKDGNQLKILRPDSQYGDIASDQRYPSGGLDSYMSVAAQRDPRDGEVKVFAADNLNQRIIVYSINDGLAPVTPPPIEPPPVTPPPPVTEPPPVIPPTQPPDQEMIAHIKIWTVPHRQVRPAIPKINDPD